MTNIIAVIIASLTRSTNSVLYLRVSFYIIFMLQALRYYYGNDYSEYIDLFANVNALQSLFGPDNDLHMEPGWCVLCRVFKPFGFYIMVSSIALFNCSVTYRFIRKYVDCEWQWFAVLYYVFSPNIMLIHLSAMRQSLAVSLFMISIDYIVKRDAIRYVICIAIASCFHLSALILLPVYALTYLDKKLSRTNIVSIFMMYVSLFVVIDKLMEKFGAILIENIEYFSTYADVAETSIGMGVLLYSLLLLLILVYIDKFSRDGVVLSKIAIWYIIVIPFGLYMSMLNRIGFYFAPLMLTVLPMLFVKIEKIIYRRILVMTVAVHTVYSSMQFMTSETYSEYYGVYKTIFSLLY